MITRWQPEWNALLGKEQDKVLARKLGVHWATVFYWRRKLGVSPCPRACVDHSGACFGRWTLLRRLPDKRDGYPYYEARCDCGRVAKVELSNLQSGYSTQCARCGRAPKKHVPGTRLGNQEIVDVTGAGKRRRYYVRCLGCGVVRKTAAVRTGEHCMKCHPRSPPDTSGERITLNGETHNFAGWAKKLGISRQALHLRIANGWPIERALTTPRSAA